MTTMRPAVLTSVLATFCLLALPVAGSAAAPTASQAAETARASAAKNGRAQLKKCARLKKKAAKRACLKQNQARKIAARQIAGYALVGARGDGEAVDWRHCPNGRWLHYTDGSYGRAISEGRSWRITHAIVRRGGKWFDAVLTQPVKGGKMQVGIARRGKRWQVAIASFDTDLSSYGDVKRTKIANKDCVAPK